MVEEPKNQTSSTAPDELTVRLTLHGLSTKEAEAIAQDANVIARRNLETEMFVEIFQKAPPSGCSCGMKELLGIRCGNCPVQDAKVGE